MVLQRFDVAEDVVPAAAVHRYDMITHGIQNLFHLEYSRKRFNQNGRTNSAFWYVEIVFGEAKCRPTTVLLPCFQVLECSNKPLNLVVRVIDSYGKSTKRSPSGNHR